jgi:hypothetical protein
VSSKASASAATRDGSFSLCWFWLLLIIYICELKRPSDCRSETEVEVSYEFKRDSEIKARYALAVLKAAQAADRETAARLILGLSRDLPHPGELPEVAALHFEAIEAFKKLAEGLRVSTMAASSWAAAAATTSKWLDMIERGLKRNGK